MSKYKLGNKSLKKLRGVHPDLVSVVRYAITITDQDFSVRDGLRWPWRQRQLVEAGVSWTMNSDHVPRKTTEPWACAHAVDLYPYSATDNSAWKDMDRLRAVAAAMAESAETLGVAIYSGGEKWGKDWFHFGLNRIYYRVRK